MWSCQTSSTDCEHRIHPTDFKTFCLRVQPIRGKLFRREEEPKKHEHHFEVHVVQSYTSLIRIRDEHIRFILMFLYFTSVSFFSLFTSDFSVVYSLFAFFNLYFMLQFLSIIDVFIYLCVFWVNPPIVNSETRCTETHDRKIKNKVLKTEETQGNTPISISASRLCCCCCCCCFHDPFSTHRRWPQILRDCNVFLPLFSCVFRSPVTL